MGVSRGQGMREVVRVKGAQYMVMEDDLTLGGGCTMQHTDHVS